VEGEVRSSHDLEPQEADVHPDGNPVRAAAAEQLDDLGDEEQRVHDSPDTGQPVEHPVGD
jgi:hypothetical protein